MKVTSLLTLVLILYIAFPHSIQAKRKTKSKKFCVGKDGNRYKVGEGYDDNKGKVCKHYKCVKKKNKFIMTKGKCGCSDAQILEVTQNEIKFHSPGFPDFNYENNQEYCWKFKAMNPQEKLSISFSSIKTEYGYDIITIYENESESENKEKVLLIASGDARPENIISHSNEIRIVFRTDVDLQMKGFEASVTAVIRKELPHFLWEKFSDGKIGVIFSKESSNPHNETIEVKLAPNFEGACVFQGTSQTTNLTIASPYSDRSCKSLSQHAQISITSVHLNQSKSRLGKIATFAIKDGILQETTEEIFSDNDLISPPVLRQGLQPLTHIEIRINLAYDRSILNKFQKFESGDSGIKKQLRQLFFFAKNHFEDLSGKTKIKLILKKDIMFIDQVIKVKNTDLKNIRKFQIDNTEPIIMICGDFDEEILEDVFITGLSYRSGACRNDASERYGVGLVAWREDLARAGETLAHEIEHMFGMTHHGHTEHDITDWYEKQGRRCYTETCPSPPDRDNGEWNCIKNNKMCKLKCSHGFSTLLHIIHCENGKFSSHLEKIACSPSVFLLTGGDAGTWDADGRHMEVYHSTNATDKNVNCSTLPTPLQHNWEQHASVFFEGVVILCGGWNTRYICSSLDMTTMEPQWLVHKIPLHRQASAVISNNYLYLFDLENSNLHWTTLPLDKIPKFTKDNKFEYNAKEYCVAQLDEDNVALTGGYTSGGESSSTATKYNVKQQTSSDLPVMKGPRERHACIKVSINQINWLVVSGGEGNGNLKTTERLNLDGGNAWETMNHLNKGRSGHQMIWTKENTLIVMGGSKYNGGSLNSIERLEWDSKSWQRLKQSLVQRNGYFSIVELPASLLGCQINTQQACPGLPSVIYGTWSCDTENTKCGIKCDPGYISTLTHTTCKGGIWSKVDRILCQPSVWLTFYGNGHSFYHPAVGHPTCSKPPPPTLDNWEGHTTFVYDNRLYNCGGDYTGPLCISLNLEDDEFQWTRHRMDISQSAPSIILENTLYIADDSDKGLISTLLPLSEEPTFTPESNVTQLRGRCVVKLNEYSFATVDYHGNINKYNAKDKTLFQLHKLDPQPGLSPACVMTEAEGTEWLVVSGGRDSTARTARLDLSRDSAIWEQLGDLNDGRRNHGMIVTPRGIVVLGGYPKTVEILSWRKQTWTYNSMEQSLWRREFVEVPASAFGCQTIPINITECKGRYKYNKKYPGGVVKKVPDGETCHSVCEKEDGCKAWTWNAKNTQCRIHATSRTTKFKKGSVSGLKGSCKPKCYLLLENQNASISKQLCVNKTDFEEKCEPLIQMAPDELQENNKIFICYIVVKKSLCEEIEYKDVKKLCNGEPSIVPLSTKKRINKHRFTRHLGSYFGKYG